MQTGLLAFHDASVAGQEASLLQGCAVRITINGVQSAGNAQADCASLAGGAATVNEDDSVELAFELEKFRPSDSRLTVYQPASKGTLAQKTPEIEVPWPYHISAQPCSFSPE